MIGAINPSSIKPLGYYIMSGLKDKLRRDSDSDFWFNPKIYDRIYSTEEDSMSSFDRLSKNNEKQKGIRSRWKRLR